MTTIAYRAGVLAADTGASCGPIRTHLTSKVARSQTGDLLIGACGQATVCAALLRWFRESADLGAMPAIHGHSEVEVIIVRAGANGCVEWHDSAGWQEVAVPYLAIGSGHEIALGAMHAGASAENAIRAAMAHDSYTWGTIQSVRLDSVVERMAAEQEQEQDDGAWGPPRSSMTGCREPAPARGGSVSLAGSRSPRNHSSSRPAGTYP